MVGVYPVIIWSHFVYCETEWIIIIQGLTQKMAFPLEVLYGKTNQLIVVDLIEL